MDVFELKSKLRPIMVCIRYNNKQQIQLEVLDALYEYYAQSESTMQQPQSLAPILTQCIVNEVIDVELQPISPSDKNITKQIIQTDRNHNTRDNRDNHQNNHTMKRKRNKNKKKSKSTSSSSSSSSSSRSSSSSSSVRSYKQKKQQSHNHNARHEVQITFALEKKPISKQADRNTMIEYEFKGVGRRIARDQNLMEKLERIHLNPVEEPEVEKAEITEDFQYSIILDRLNLQNELQMNAQNRYFQTNHFQHCFRCKQNGHVERQCVYEAQTVCPYCISPDHGGDKCINHACFRCNALGHRKAQCQVKLHPSYCAFCAKKSHKSSDCGILMPTKPNSQAVCVHCMQKGHFNCAPLVLIDDLF